MHLLSFDEDGELSLATYEDDKCPPYAILSHTWYADEDEVTYDDVINGRGKNRLGRDKIMFCGEQASKDDLKHFWVDSCCIDKTSSAELSESLNSMFRWYQRASKCYVYLSDVEMMQNNRHASTLSSWKTAFQKSRWFTRGWTLQELIAPEAVEFWSSDRYMLGTKADLSDLIHQWTGLPLRALKGAPVASFSINERLRWAALRETKKSEDKAYCLLGIFEVFMPPIYGEGGDHAFDRLRKAIDDKLRLSLQDRGEAHHDRGEKVNEHRKSVLASLDFPELGARQANIRNVHQNTCEWILEHADYSKWSSSDRGTFWIVGKPGAGKSTLMKLLHSKANEGKSEYEFVFGFFFNARGNTLEKTTNGMYRALLFELFKAFPKLQTILDGKKPSTEWTLHSLKHLLSDMIQKVGPRTLRLFIDALDECDEQEIQEMVEVMEEIQDNFAVGTCMLSICFASRHYPSITIRNGIRMNLDEATGHLNDLNMYIEQRLQIQGEGTLVHEIYQEVRRKANGVFLWAVLVIDILNKEIRRGRMRHIKTRLDEIPSGLSALFLEILQRDDEEMEEFLLCVQWILFAARPLSPAQFYFAMESGLQAQVPSGGVWRPDPWDPERVTIDQIERFVQTSSKGLAEVVRLKDPWGPGKSNVQFIHESIPDFFIKDGHLSDLFPNHDNGFHSQSHDKLKSCCLNYLALDPSEGARHHDSGDVYDVYPFLHYANANVLYHANEAADGIAQDRFFDIYPSEHYIDVASSLGYNHSPKVNLVHLAAEKGFARLIPPAREKGYNVWEWFPNHPWRCAAVAAFVYGHRDALEALLGGVTVSFRRDIIQDPGFGRAGHVFDGCNHLDLDRGVIVWAVECGNWTMAENLARVNGHNRILLGDAWTDTTSQIALAVPSSNPRMQVLEQLLVNVPWFNAGLALIAATYQDQTAIVQCILDHNDELSRRDVKAWIPAPNVDMNVPPGYRSSSSSWQQAFGHLLPSSREIVWTDFVLHALRCAIMQGRTATVRTFVDNDINVNAQYDDNCYPLLLASALGNSTTLSLLLDGGADIDARGNPFGSALHAAVVGDKSCTGNFDHGRDTTKDQTEIVRLLLDRGADPNSPDEDGGTAFYSAAGMGRQEMMELLLHRGADIDAVGGHFGDRGTALQTACSQRRTETIHFLLARGADVNANSGTFKTALQAAAKNGDKDIVQVLLEHGADVNAINTQSRFYGTALGAASRSGHEDIASLLIDVGADINGCDHSTGTALYHACAERHHKIIKMLIDRGADLNPNCCEHGNALFAAARSGYSDIVSILLDRGAHIDACGKATGTALYYACQSDSPWGLKTVELLVDRGADMNIGCGGHGSPLQAACKSKGLDATEIVRLLLSRGAECHFGNCLNIASQASNPDTVRLLLSLGSPIDEHYVSEALETASAAHRKSKDDGLKWTAKRSSETISILLSSGAKYRTKKISGSSLPKP